MNKKDLYKEILLFIIVLCIIFFGFEWHGFQERAESYSIIKRRIQESSEKKIVFMGSSHTAFGICDTFFNVINLGARNEPYFFTLKKIQAIHPKTVVLSLNVQNLQFNYDNTFDRGLLNVKQFEYFSNHLTKEEKQDIFSLMDFETRAFYETKKLIPFIGKRLAAEDTTFLLGRWEDTQNRSELDSFKINKRYADEFVKTNFKISQFQFKYLYKLFEYCHANNIKLIVISTPLYPGFYKKIPAKSYDDFTKILHDLKRKYQFVYYDYTKYKIPPDHFLDSDHLNGKGASLFTKILLDQLRKDGMHL